VLRKKRFLIGGIIIFLAIGYLIYGGLKDLPPYFSEVSELLEQGNSIYAENVRVRGQVAPGSIEQETKEMILRFTIIDVEKEASLPVVYHGVVPDTFKAGREAVIEGQLNSDGIFQAHTLMPKCPSRYVPQQ